MARGDGRIFRRGQVWWVAWCLSGRERRESSRSTDERSARRLLRVRLGQLARGERPQLGDQQRRVGEILDHYLEDRTNAGRASAATQKSVRWLRRHFGAWRVTEITLAALTPWCATQRKTYASGTLRQHMAYLKAALTVARRAGLIEHRADFPILAAGAARKGFYSPSEATAHLAAFEDSDVADLASFLYLTGWRFNEGRELVWTEVDRAAHVVTLAPARTKTREGRTLPLVGALAGLLERRWKARRLGCSWVFHRRGKRITEYRFRARFREALASAELGPKLPHDMRRSMSRDQIRAGVSKPVAMANTGHRDPRMFDRYDITAVEDQARGLQATEAYRAARAKSDIPSDRAGVSA